MENIQDLKSQPFNIGSGSHNSMSVLELIDLLDLLHTQRCEVRFNDRRQADQNYFVSDVRRFQSFTGWFPKVETTAGIRVLYEWIQNEII